MKNWVKDTLLSIFLIIISIATYTVAREYPDIASHFPSRLAWVLGGLAAALLVKSLFVTRVKDAQGTTDISSIKGVFVIVAAIAVYTLVLKYAGYLVSSFCLLLILLLFDPEIIFLHVHVNPSSSPVFVNLHEVGSYQAHD